MNTCQTCKHWVENDENDYGVMGTLGWGKCQIAESKLGDIPPDTMALAVDAEEYWAVLITRPSFGCNQHEPKEMEVAEENH